MIESTERSQVDSSHTNLEQILDLHYEIDVQENTSMQISIL